ncbi:MAG: N-acetyl-gamma-glutamyl-phosphate reductase [Deltaproteobacteria bacterium]|nr:N-acetyl-gamma-glutamyl-phosphate reductase [Deltaproteobacteria bacterium]
MSRVDKVRVGIVGASGFLGGELVRLLHAHPYVEITMLGGASSAGKRLAELRPGLSVDQPIEAIDANRLAERCDLVFLALPHGESGSLAKQLLGYPHLRIIDLGSDFRLRSAADHQTYYGREPIDEPTLQLAHYSLPELTGAPPTDCRLIANPGCFATALALGIHPLKGQLAPGARISVCGVTGSSGSGIAPTSRVHHSLRPTNYAAYKVLSHQHLGELRQLLGAVDFEVDFVPHSGPMTRGIHLTIMLRKSECRQHSLAAIYRQAFADAPLVDVQAGPVDMGAVIGSCRALIGVEGDESTAVVFVAIDNLLKGGSGQAVQNMNLLCGWSETTALPTLATWP